MNERSLWCRRVQLSKERAEALEIAKCPSGFCEFVEHSTKLGNVLLIVARERLLELTLTATRLPIIEPPTGV